MFILHAPRFPPGPVPVERVRKAWLDAGFTKLGVRNKDSLHGEEIKGIVQAQLLAAGATLAGIGSSDFEVPDEAEPLLKALELFFYGLYPEMEKERPRRAFHYEKTEWLGEF